MSTPRAKPCRYCAKPIAWGRTPAGRNIPLEAEQNPGQGTIVLYGGTATLEGSAERALAERERGWLQGAALPDITIHSPHDCEGRK